MDAARLLPYRAWLRDRGGPVPTREVAMVK